MCVRVCHTQYMTTTRTAQIAEATANRDAARTAYNTTTGKARRNAAEELEFWSSKLAMLNVTTGWA